MSAAEVRGTEPQAPAGGEDPADVPTEDGLDGGPSAEDSGVDDEPQPIERTRWLRSIGYGLSIGALLLVLLVACLTIAIPKLAGAVPLTVLTNSMAPSVPAGSLVVVKPTMRLDPRDELSTMTPAQIRRVNNVARIRAGDVIAFQPNAVNKTLIIHRVIQVTIHADGRREFVTRGDNNRAPDSPVMDYMVRAKVWYGLPLLGYVNTFFNGDGTRHTTAVLIIAATGYGFAFHLFSLAIRRSNAGQEDRDFAHAAS